MPPAEVMSLPPGAAVRIPGPTAAATGRLEERASDAGPDEHAPTATPTAATSSHHRIMRSPRRGRIPARPRALSSPLGVTQGPGGPPARQTGGAGRYLPP